MSRENRFPPSDLPLLDELDNIRSLLGDGLDIPLLEPEPTDAPAPSAATSTTPSTKTARPLAPACPPASTSRATVAERPAPAPVHQALVERENPFLPRQTMERLAQHRAHTPESLRPPVPPPASPATPSDSDVRAAVDEILAVWLPRIERELRDHLTRQLQGKGTRGKDDA